MYRFWVVKRGPVCLIGQHCVAFKKENSPIHLRGLAALVIWKVRVLWYEFTDVTLAWEDGQWVEAHKIILAGCSPKKAPQPSCLSWMVLILMSRKQKRKRQTGPVFGCPKLVLWRRQLKKGARQDHLLRPDQPNHWFWLIKRVIKKINAESAVFTLSCFFLRFTENVKHFPPFPSVFFFSSADQVLASIFCFIWNRGKGKAMLKKIKLFLHEVPPSRC